jgi:hypothetical protein
MPKPRPGPDEEDDTAFGGLAPRSGPRIPGRARRRGGTGKWVAAVIVAILILLVLHYVTGRL